MSSRGMSIGIGPTMTARRLVVRAKDVVFVKGIVEAHDGLAHVFSESGGDLTIASCGKEEDLDALVLDLAREFGGIATTLEGERLVAR